MESQPLLKSENSIQKKSLGLKQPRWYEQEAARLLLGAIFVLGAGTAVGYATKIPSDLTPTWGRVSNVMGGIYFMAWSLSFYPQAILNYTRKSVVGLSFDYQVYNVIGFTCYSIFNCLFFWSGPVQEDYRQHHHGKNNQVQASDVFFAIHALALTLVTVWQIAIYERGAQSVSTTCYVVCGICIAAMVVMALLCQFHNGGVFIWLNFYSLIADIKLAVTLVKFLPQVYLNYKRKSTDGMNIHNFLLDFTGGSLSVAQLCMDARLTHDWSAITGDVAKFGLGSVSMVYDVVLLTQHYCIYTDHGQGQVYDV
eukprot:m.35707 g.35707  ORF g.35707 m.35707 type:complete len:310 (-) comp12420_c0_seq3:88-1017(-)